MRVAVIHPPQATWFSPYLAGPSLAAVLRRAGHEVELLDLNLSTNRTMLSAAYLGRHLGARGSEIGDRAEAAIRALGEPGAYATEDAIVAAFRAIDGGYAAASELAPGTTLGYDLETPWAPLSVAGLNAAGIAAAPVDRDRNPFLALFEEDAIPRLRRLQPEVVGIGLAYESQLIPTATLTGLIHRALPDTRIVVGGNVITKLHHRLLATGYLFDGVDFAVIGEGETPLIALLEAISRDERGIETVPNLIRRGGEGLVMNALRHEEDMALLPTPDFTGLPLDDYLLPIRLVPLLTSRGCYWGRCAFCTHQHGYGRFRMRPVDRLVEDVETLTARHDTATLFLADEAVPPRQIRALAGVADRRDGELHWFGDARLERSFADPAFVDVLTRSGCRLLAFGLESASQRVLDRMDKGGSPERFAEVLRACHDAGIFTVAMFFSGFPGETLQEAHETVRFVQTHRDIIDAWGNTSFSLQGGSGVRVDPGRYGVTEMRRPEGLDLAEFYDYDVMSGLSAASAAQIADAVRRAAARDPKHALTLPREVTFARRVLGG